MRAEGIQEQIVLIYISTQLANCQAEIVRDLGKGESLEGSSVNDALGITINEDFVLSFDTL